MILQQLRNDAERLVDLPPSMYDRKPVRWVVRLERDGRAHWPPERLSGGEGKKDRGKSLLVPFKNRSGTRAPALLLADKVSFTWGLPADGPRTAAEHERYLDLLNRCAAATGDPDVAAIARFFETWDPERQPLPEDVEPPDLTTFMVEDRYPIDSPAVRAFWAREAGGAEASGTPGQCLVCGLHTQVVERLPVFLKGIPQAQATGAALVSANAQAFESYGRAAALTSPICLDCGERFGKAANALLEDPSRRYRIGPVAYIFWAPEAEFDPAAFFSDPDPEQVRLLLESASTGKPVAADDTPFYAAALSAAISRVIVRGWVDTTVGDARKNLARWFRLQEVVDPYGAPGKPLSVFRLSVGLYFKSDDIVARVPEALLGCALHGGPLPDWLLLKAVQRNQAERDVTQNRAALIKAVLCSREREGGEPMAELNPADTRPAYHCGRLLAELESIQQLAVPGIKATLVDRYYTGASTSPARVFGSLLSGVQAHLGKLRKERPGAYQRRSEALEEIMASLGGFPRTLTIQDQALFSLGYYHQRAADRAARRLAAEQKRDKTEPSTEANEDE
ncbi:MAG: type I-C CRISPR-associated protein Cas8c/Csd1 [Actinomycetota bacterium]